jgi:hypothetical protein
MGGEGLYCKRTVGGHVASNFLEQRLPKSLIWAEFASFDLRVWKVTVSSDCCSPDGFGSFLWFFTLASYC